MNRWERRIKRKLKSIANNYALLSRDPAQQHESIHRARRLTKQLRALIALLPKSFQHSIRKIIRDQKQIVQQLGLLRDESLFRQNIAILGATLDTTQAIDIDPSISQDLESHPFNIDTPLNQLAANVSRIQHRLQGCDEKFGRQSIARQWKRTCQHFLDQYQRLWKDGAFEQWHEVRKAAKLLEYQLRFLGKYSHHAASPIAELVTDLGKRLGHLNDFAKAKESLTLQKTPMGHLICLDSHQAEELLLEIAEGCEQEKQTALELLEKIVPLLEQLTELKARELIE